MATGTLGRSRSRRASDPSRAARYASLVKKRLDVVLVERGLADTRAKAQALVIAGRIKGYRKAGIQVDESVPLEVEAGARFVSRGGEKLAHALAAFCIDAAGKRCLDVGASTGGFTDCLLQAGAAQVVALDVGKGQLDVRLREDPRVTVLEGQNARHLHSEMLPYAPTLITCDVAFISVRLALPPAFESAAPGWQAVVLIKPQFEAGRADVPKGGIVRDPATHRRVLRETADVLAAHGGVRGLVTAPIRGAKGNREFFVHLAHGRASLSSRELDAAIDSCVG